MGLPFVTLWLSEPEKTHRLAELERDIEAELVDQPLIPYLRRLNHIDWLCTAQSCQGHEPYGTAIKNLGHISFRIKLDGWQPFLNALYRYEERFPALGWCGFTVEANGAEGAYPRFEVWWSEPSEWEERIQVLCHVMEEARDMQRQTGLEY